MSNPFSPGTTSYRDFDTMSDLEWHCTKCELESAQAKTWQVWRQKGIQLATDESGNWFKRLFCSNCGKTTIHRGLASLELLEDTRVRAGIPQKLARRIKETYSYQEAVLLRKLLPRQLEIDHRFPQVRWGQDEEPHDVNMSAADIKAKFILLNRSHNLLKSRYCERCVDTGRRGQFPGVEYWYEGDGNWDSSIDPNDERGCEGCFWYDPYRWREELNRLLKQAQER